MPPGAVPGADGEVGGAAGAAGETAAEPGAFVVTTEDPVNGVPRGLLLGRITGTSSARNPLPRVGVDPILNFRAREHVMLLVPPITPARPSAGLPAEAQGMGAKAGGGK